MESNNGDKNFPESKSQFKDQRPRQGKRIQGTKLVFRNKKSIYQEESQDTGPLDVTYSGRLSRNPGERDAQTKANFDESHARFQSWRKAKEILFFSMFTLTKQIPILPSCQGKHWQMNKINSQDSQMVPKADYCRGFLTNCHTRKQFQRPAPSWRPGLWKKVP